MKRSMISIIAGAAMLCSAPSAIAQTIGFATLPVGAINNVQAQVIAKVVQNATGMQIRVIPVGGSSATLASVATGAAEITIGDVVNMSEAFYGKHGFPRPSPNLRVVLTISAFPIGIMIRNDSPVKTMADFKGKRFPTGWQQFPAGIPLANGNFATAGYGIDDMDPVPSSGLIPAADDFKAGKSDGTVIALIAPKVAEVNAAIPGGVRFLSVDDTPEALKRMQAVRDEYYILPIHPGPRYPGVRGVTNVLGVNLVLTSSTAVSDEVIYKFVKAMAENRGELIKGHPSFNGFDAGKLMATKYRTVKHHPGAIKYFQERGLW